MKLVAEKRAPGKASAVRKAGRLPGVVYNKETNIPISVETRAFDKTFRSQGTSNIIDLDIGGESHDVLVRAVQMNKRRREPIHVDFYAVTAGQVVEVAVSIDFVGTPAGAKQGGQVDIQRRDVRINILPRLIPSNLEVDISELTIGDSIHISDVISKLPSEAEVLDEPERTLVTVLAPRVAEEETAEEEVTQPEVIGQDDEIEGSDEDTSAE